MIDLATETLLTTTQAAARLGKSRGTIKRWIHSGKLEGIKLPGGLHTSMEAIERMAERLSREAGIGRPIPSTQPVQPV